MTGASFPVDLEAALDEFVAGGGLAQFPYPKTAIGIANLMFSFNFMVGPLVRLIESDASLAAAVVRRASSAALARSGPCQSVRDAVTRLGGRQVGSLIAAHRFGNFLDIVGPLLPLRRVFWREAFSSALICDGLALLRGLPSQKAFACGLQHDLGRVLVAASLEKILLAQPPDLALPSMDESFWIQLVESHHLRLGLRLAELWGLPDQVRAAIEHHHQPERAAPKHAQLVELVAIADAANAILASSTSIPADELRSLPQLRNGDERELLLQTLLELPAFVADLSASRVPDGVDQARPLSVRASSLGRGAARELPVHCRQRGSTSSYRTEEVGQGGLLMTGERPLLERFLAQVSFREDPELSVWAEVMRCSPGERGFEIELRPFALTAAQLARWRALVGEPAPTPGGPSRRG